MASELDFVIGSWNEKDPEGKNGVQTKIDIFGEEKPKKEINVFSHKKEIPRFVNSWKVKNPKEKYVQKLDRETVILHNNKLG